MGSVCGDRGFDGKANRQLLENEGIYNAICPKAPGELKERMKEAEFAGMQTGRSQTEARIAIFKKGFPGAPLMSKGHGNQSREASLERAGAQFVGDRADAARSGQSAGKSQPKPAIEIKLVIYNTFARSSNFCIAAVKPILSIRCKVTNPNTKPDKNTNPSAELA